MRYTYIAKDNYYLHGESYPITVRKHWFGRITVEWQHGYGGRVYTGSRRKYRNWKEFNKDWVKV